jgi:hypothetical protein
VTDGWVGDVYLQSLGLVRPLEELARPASEAVIRSTLDGVRRHRLPGEAPREDRWDLYAVHLLGSLLRTAFQAPRRVGPGAPRRTVDVADYTAWWRSLGFDVVTASGFHPFFHEIVAVEAAADPDAACEITSTIWPCLFWGRLLFSRAGVTVRAGRHVIDPVIATDSTLYWEHLRVDRPCQDLSNGWGSNSRWRTSFRRDYAVGGRLLYNVDAARVVQPRTGIDEWSEDERDQLLRHRCSVRAPALDDAWPYHFHAEELVPPELTLAGLASEDAASARG